MEVSRLGGRLVAWFRRNPIILSSIDFSHNRAQYITHVKSEQGSQLRTTTAIKKPAEQIQPQMKEWKHRRRLIYTSDMEMSLKDKVVYTICCLPTSNIRLPWKVNGEVICHRVLTPLL